ncbi:MAG: MMPL family transporter [Gammaproteobacteria bacterium]|nr:MMPL family transporter [Gammaproteobacteria bacterium]
MSKINNLLRRYAEFILRYRLAVLLAILTVTLLLGSRISNLKIDMDPDIWSPQENPYVITTRVVEQVFGGRNVTVIGIVPKTGDIYQPAILAKIQRIQDGIETMPDAIRHNILSLAARKVKHIKGTRDGMEVRAMMDTIPQTPQEIARLKAAVADSPMYLNTLVTPDGKATAIIADFNLPKDDPRYTPLYENIRKIVDPERDAQVDIYMGGGPPALAWFEFHMAKMPLFFGVALLIIMAIQYWSFRSLQGMLLPIFTALLSVIWGLGLMGLLDVHMDGMNTTTPILIMAVAAGHAIQILKRYYEEYHRLSAQANAGSPASVSRAAIIESLAQIGPVMVTAGLIAVITFYSLSTAEISVVRHFGIFAGSGILGALILELTLIPVLRSYLRAPKTHEAENERRVGMLDRLLGRLADLLASGRAIWLLGIGIIFIAVTFAGVTMLHADNSLKRYNSKNSEIRLDDDALNARFAGTASMIFLVEGKEQDSLKDPKVLQGMATLQEFLEKQPYVGKTQSLADLVKRMNRAMHNDDAAYDVIPDKRDLLAQYLFLYSISGDPQDFDNVVDNDYQKAVIWVYLKDDSTAYAEALYQRALPIIQKNFPPSVNVRLGGQVPNVVAVNDSLTRGKFENMAQMALVVFALSTLVLRSFVGGLFVVTPLLLIILANFGLMGWLGVPLDMGTAMTAAMAIGIGADYELYLLFRFREELARTGDVGAATRNSLLTSGKAIVFVALSVAGGYAVLLASDFGFYIRLAVMVITTMLVSAVSALVFLRAMMMLFKPRFVFGKNRELWSNPVPVIEGANK